MTLDERIITIAIVAAATALTRFLPFIIFPTEKRTPRFVKSIAGLLPGAVLGMLVVYCFSGVSFVSGTHGIPELIASAFVILLHLRFRKMLISIAGGTICYILLLQLVF